MATIDQRLGDLEEAIQVDDLKPWIVLYSNPAGPEGAYWTNPQRTGEPLTAKEYAALESQYKTVILVDYVKGKPQPGGIVVKTIAPPLSFDDL